MRLVVNKVKCPQNHKCPSMAVCPKSAITQENIYALPRIDAEKCIVCEKCVKYCPKGAIEKVASRDPLKHPTQGAPMSSLPLSWFLVFF